MRKTRGFTLVELIIFIVIMGIIGVTILFAVKTVLQGGPTVNHQMVATRTAERCVEWYLGQRRMKTYTGIALGSSVPSFCVAPSGYSISTNVASTTYYGDSNYKTVTVTVSGAGSATFRLLLADY
ncbi:MAG: prepilin-type N-terminal cleavage/methylation domain-containing protein [Pseudomonadota bacterium]|nr:prepilin-type N-terminal cleavage/methylation domain-containing protein [Gammaproteobacteria bacterium]MBU1558896.1 prepilin-type N-terminal cleavage/methylation domain-containing protein [Gammaproteobacteria bacterium]MBU1628819.1 prepilin-type N-terminal cleavage/methylation domain-containing protein [Gammaproteobacteria bacterium]MBU1926608.1 prepilin-type N-terminal cleavage/methylation domain-containing protein [Gammaproteobacteria bacterium]MBU2545833.1 prepilin-type N-terminal cleavag